MIRFFNRNLVLWGIAAVCVIATSISYYALPKIAKKILSALDNRRAQIEREIFLNRYEFLVNIRKLKQSPFYNYIQEQDVGFDIFKEVRSFNKESLQNLRGSIIRAIFGNELPKAKPTMHCTASTDTMSARTCEMNFTTSVSQYTYNSVGLYQIQPNANCLFLYHAGHDEGFEKPMKDAEKLWQKMGEKGCDIIKLSMPLTGDNKSQPLMKNSKPIYGNGHATFSQDDLDPVRAFSFFLSPTHQALNAALDLRKYAQVIMAGRSGGGWTTVIAAAIDPRISQSYSIAGTVPGHFRLTRKTDRGDWEQWDHPFWTNITSYSELYLLAVLEPNRRSTHLYKKYDICCFQGLRMHAFFPTFIAEAQRRKFGALRYYVDDEEKYSHEVSTSIINTISQHANLENHQ